MSNKKEKVFKMSVHLKLRVAMAQKDIHSIRELAELIGISRTHMSRICNGHSKRLDLDVLNNLCNVLECQPGDILVHEPDNKDAA